MPNERAFTLIELLIVVAIIAILAAIAVPNFLEAQMRAKVSRVKADQRSIATAIEAYRTDNNRYPYYADWGTWPPPRVQSEFTTPISYMTSVPHDVFSGVDNDAWKDYYYYYNKLDDTRISDNQNLWDGTFSGPPECGYGKGKTGSEWGLYSRSVDRLFNWAMPAALQVSGLNDGGHQAMEYDATNGTTSWGDIHRWGP